MACIQPIPAYRHPTTGAVTLWKRNNPTSEELAIPCGGCLACRRSKAREWAHRCWLELQEHETATFATFTYNDDNLPPTLCKMHLQNMWKRLRHKTSPLRYFASGEYGERTARPHYHAIIYGLDPTNAMQKLQPAWLHGFTAAAPVTSATISYVAGYCAKKIGWREEPKEQVDPRTGEVYTWQPPFILMSRGGKHGHGIGGAARDRYTSQWRDKAIWQGRPIPVPRYLHAKWKETATPEALQQLEHEKKRRRQQYTQQTIQEKDTQRNAALTIARNNQQRESERRNY